MSHQEKGQKLPKELGYLRACKEAQDILSAHEVMPPTSRRLLLAEVLNLIPETPCGDPEAIKDLQKK